MTIGESRNTDKQVQVLNRFLQGGGSRLLTRLTALGASSTIDISLHVGSRKHFAKWIEFPPQLLLLLSLSQLGVRLMVSAYPVSDD